MKFPTCNFKLRDRYDITYYKFACGIKCTEILKHIHFRALKLYPNFIFKK